MTAASRTAVHPASSAPGANVITIASGKGGVGKTWLAISLAHALARQGRRALLFDGDLGLANVDIQLGLEVTKDLGDVVSGQAAMRDAVTRFDDGSFDILAGKSGSGVLADLDAQRMKSIQQDLWQLSQQYDSVVLDLGAGVEAGIRALSPKAGTTLVLATDEPTSLTDAYAYIKVTAMKAPKADIRIAINMAASTKQGERTFETLRKACRNFLKLSPPLAGIVRRDDKVRECIRRQTAFLSRYPTDPVAEDIEALAAALIKGR